jgi:hypothetical protein
MSESNGYPVHGTLRLLQRGDMTLEDATETVNLWIESTARRFYTEGELDGKRQGQKKSHQALCDMTPEDSAERGFKAPVSWAKGIEVQSHHLVKKEG